MRNIDMSYYNVYYYCGIVDNLLNYFTGSIDWAPTGAQFTEPFFEGEIPNFPKYTALHQFCEYAIRTLMLEEAESQLDLIQDKYNELDSHISKAKRLRLAFDLDGTHRAPLIEIDYLFKHFDIKHETFYSYLLNSDFQLISDEYNDFLTFDADFENILEKLARELFYILFQNREFLLRFNLYLANANPSKIRRCNIPSWVKRAVQYRDRGRCVNCGKDVSGQFDCEDTGAVHYDHIVSLHDGGLNDVCNIQLMCRECNLKKSSGSYTSSTYKDWYDFELE